ncbi:MAG: monofunctional biosynthetic peptidoglycan transglycosylase [Bacteroidales bacterium]|nr:monofunctional biosynthetic peptidoglycan transglycosylase [Bacteroidales bacterium]MBR5665420.1 monofunctional biosynthetic peptidoglycan transglycosylase [Bacteroidales bacterium]
MAAKKRKKKAAGKRHGHRFWKVTAWVVGGFFLFTILLTLAYRWINPPITPLMVGRSLSGEPRVKTWVPITEISPNLVQAAVASEDNRFCGHRGFDFSAIQRAIDHNRTHSRKWGASTISQQTAKNVFLWSGRSWIRKGFEVYFTFLIEHLWGKERIMEVYLNVIEMGHGIYGAEAASQHYFHCSAKKLNARQSALLTACYPNPRRWNPAHPTPYISRSATRIQNMMPKMGRIRFDKESLQKARERYLEAEGRRIAKNDGKRLKFK